MTASGVSDNFSQQAHFYARYRPSYPDKMFEFIFKHLEQKQNAWDCGTGSGQVAGYLADYFTQVYASDISPEQMKYAVKKPNITYAQLPAENTDYPNSYFDLISIAQAIHWFDFNAFYREVRRVAKPNALIAAFGYGLMTVNPDIDPIFKELYTEVFGKYFTKVRKYLNEEYKTIPFPFEEIPSPRFSINLQWSMSHMEGFLNSWSPIQKIKENEGYNPADAVIKLVKDNYAPNQTLDVSFPIFLRLGKVHHPA